MSGPTTDQTDNDAGEHLHRTAADLTTLADRIDTGVTELAFHAEHATTELADRGYCDMSLDEQDAWAGRKADAAMAAQQYTDRLRAQAASMRADDTVPDNTYDQAAQVALATEVDGILIDGRPVAEATATDGSIWHEYERDLWNAGKHPAQEKAARIEATGAFTHVAKGQVPFWQLTPQATGEDTDEF